MRRTLVALLLLAPGLVARLRRPRRTPPRPTPPAAEGVARRVRERARREDERFAVFTGSMPALPRDAADGDALRPLHPRRSARRAWLPVKAQAASGRWQRSTPGREGFVYTKRVERLLPGRRVPRRRALPLVRRRRGVQARATACAARRCAASPTSAPNLQVESLRDRSPAPTRRRRATSSPCVNAGRTAAGRVRRRPRRRRRDDVRTVAGLPAGERATVEIVGAALPAGRARSARTPTSAARSTSPTSATTASARACDGR